MLILFRNAQVYSPDHLGKKDILTGGRTILSIKDHLEPPPGTEVSVIDCKGLRLVPGLIDSHVHIYSNGESSESTSMPIRDNPLSRAMMAVPRLKRTLEMGITTLRGMAGRGGGGWR